MVKPVEFRDVSVGWKQNKKIWRVLKWQSNEEKNQIVGISRILPIRQLLKLLLVLFLFHKLREKESNRLKIAYENVFSFGRLLGWNFFADNIIKTI